MGGEVGINRLIRLNGRIPCSLGTGGTAEGNARNAFFRRFGGCADCARNEDRATKVCCMSDPLDFDWEYVKPMIPPTSDITTRNGYVWLASKKHGGESFDPIAHRRDRVGIHVVEASHGSIISLGRRSDGTRTELTFSGQGRRWFV